MEIKSFYVKMDTLSGEPRMKPFVDFIENVRAYSGVKVCAVEYVISGNSHDENYQNVYDVFDAGVWTDYFEAKRNSSGGGYYDRAIVNYSDIETFDFYKWADYKSSNNREEENYRRIYIEHNGEKKILSITKAVPNRKIIYETKLNQKEREMFLDSLDFWIEVTILDN